MFHAISGWLTRHARRNRHQLARDMEFAAINGWYVGKVNRRGTWVYRDPRFAALTSLPAEPAVRTAQVRGSTSATHDSSAQPPDTNTTRRCSR